MGATDPPEEVLDRLFAALEAEPAADAPTLAARHGVAETLARRCQATVQALEARSPEPARAGLSLQLSAGERVGNYELLREVGRGGMGVVFQARDLRDPAGGPVALKLLSAGLGASPAQQRRFQRESLALMRLRHPHVVALLEAGSDRGLPWLALEWIEGESLAARLSREGPLDPHLATALVAKVAGALEHCHARGVVHRDVKPGNVLLRASDGEPLLCDFGLARDLEPGSLTGTGQALGTPGYLAPEQARGEQAAIGPRTDVWGLGALLFALLTGRPPVPPRPAGGLLLAFARDPPPPSSKRPGLPRALDRVCQRALAIDPELRWGSAGELARELAAPPEGPGRDRPWRRRTIALVGALLLGGLVLWATRPADTTPPTARGPVPEPTGSRVARGWALLERGQIDLAEVELREALALDPADSGARASLERLRAERGDPDGALAACREALERAPGAAPFHLVLGQILWSKGDRDAALSALERASELAPDDARAHRELGSLRSWLGDHPGALRALERAHTLAPGDPVTLLERGLALHRSGDKAGALADLDRAILADPERAVPYQARAAVRDREGDFAGALADLDRALELGGEVWVHIQRAETRARAGDARGALEDYRLAQAKGVALEPHQLEHVRELEGGR